MTDFVSDFAVPCPHCGALIGWGCMTPRAGGYFRNKRPVAHAARKAVAALARTHLAGATE
jgi:hypothetical protein